MFYYDVESNELKCKSLADLIILKKADTIEDSVIITDEQSDYIKICDDCGVIININNDEYYTTYDNRVICENCYSDNYFTCEDCGEVRYWDEHIRVNPATRDEKCVCPDCSDTYNKCLDCGEYFADGYLTFDSNGDALCENCIDEYYICEDCGCFIHNVDVYFDDNDYSYCSSCYYDNSHDNTYIHNYSYMPDLVVNSTIDDTAADKLKTYGFELEVSADESTAGTYLSYFSDDEIYLTSDSSIINDGYEITSHPMTYNYLFNSQFTENFKKSLEYLKSVNAHGHNHGGLHIHLNRDALSKKQLAIITAILYKAANYDLILMITQRKKADIEHWAALHTELTPVETYEKILIYGFLYSSKYQGINFNHDDTIEFRIFNSNIRFERFKKNFEFIELLLDYTKTLEDLSKDKIISSTKNFSLTTVLAWASMQNTNKYDNLLAFINEKSSLLMAAA